MLRRGYDLAGLVVAILALGVAVAIAAAFIGAAVHGGAVPGYAVYAMFALIGAIIGICGAYVRTYRHRYPTDPPS